jgi:hypothetical protein
MSEPGGLKVPVMFCRSIVNTLPAGHGTSGLTSPSGPGVIEPAIPKLDEEFPDCKNRPVGNLI